jgi:hypothetical protein
VFVFNNMNLSSTLLLLLPLLLLVQCVLLYLRQATKQRDNVLEKQRQCYVDEHGLVYRIGCVYIEVYVLYCCNVCSIKAAIVLCW